LGNRRRPRLQFVYNFRIPPWQIPCAVLVFLFCARPGPALSLAMFITPPLSGAGQIRRNGGNP
jgi:hypothetical protein